MPTLSPYFAHPVTVYDDEATKANPAIRTIEKSCVDLIAHNFSIPRLYSDSTKTGVANPNEPGHQEGYKKWAADRASAGDTKHSGMQYFYQEVLPELDSIVCLPFLDGRMGLGVAGEAQRQLAAGKPGFIFERMKAATQENIEAFKRNFRSGLYYIRPFTEDEIGTLLSFKKDDVPSDLEQAVLEGKLEREKVDWEWLIVPHHETRLRTWLNVYNVEPKVPFETAHLLERFPKGFYPKAA